MSRNHLHIIGWTKRQLKNIVIKLKPVYRMRHNTIYSNRRLFNRSLKPTLQSLYFATTSWENYFKLCKMPQDGTFGGNGGQFWNVSYVKGIRAINHAKGPNTFTFWCSLVDICITIIIENSIYQNGVGKETFGMRYRMTRL